MNNIKDSLCSIISTIMPEDNEISCYEQQADDLKITRVLLDLLLANTIFKTLVACINCSKDECESCSNRIFKSLEQLCSERSLHNEWKKFSIFHLRFVYENYAELNPAVQNYLYWEMKHVNTDISADEELICQQEENEDVVIEYLYNVLANEQKLLQEELSLRCLFETILILDTHILNEERFKELIENNKPALQNVLAYEN